MTIQQILPKLVSAANTRWTSHGGQFYLAACVQTRYGRAGIVLNGPSQSKLIDFADNLKNRIGYCGCNSLDEAVKRAGMMERNETGAWGPL